MTRALIAFGAAAVLIVLLPGPDTLVVVRNVLRGGRRQATLTALGVLTGLVVWVGAAALGLSTLLRASRTGYDALRIVGAIYLLWLGVQSLRSRTAPAEVVLPEPVRRRSLLGNGFGAGVATDLLNPKVGVFFVSFLPAFIPSGSDAGLASLALGAVFIVLTALYFAALIAIADRVVAWMTEPRTRKRLDRAAGLVFIGFGIRLVTE